MATGDTILFQLTKQHGVTPDALHRTCGPELNKRVRPHARLTDED